MTDIEELEQKIKTIVEQFQMEQSCDKRILLARHKIKLLYQIRQIELNNLK